MTNLRFRLPLVALAATLGLAACTSNDGIGVPRCPRTVILGDANRYVEFIPNTGTVAFEARLMQVGGECVYPKDKKRVTVNMVLTMGVQRGAAAPSSRVQVGYFVAVVDPDQRVLGRQEFQTPIEFRDNRAQVVLSEELEQIIPLTDGKPAAAYDVVVGFLLTQEQLNLNRSAPR